MTHLLLSRRSKSSSPLFDAVYGNRLVSGAPLIVPRLYRGFFSCQMVLVFGRVLLSDTNGVRVRIELCAGYGGSSTSRRSDAAGNNEGNHIDENAYSSRFP